MALVRRGLADPSIGYNWDMEFTVRMNFTLGRRVETAFYHSITFLTGGSVYTCDCDIPLQIRTKDEYDEEKLKQKFALSLWTQNYNIIIKREYIASVVQKGLRASRMF